MSWIDQRPDDAMMGSFEAVGAEHIATVEAAQFREAMTSSAFAMRGRTKPSNAASILSSRDRAATGRTIHSPSFADLLAIFPMTG